MEDKIASAAVSGCSFPGCHNRIKTDYSAADNTISAGSRRAGVVWKTESVSSEKFSETRFRAGREGAEFSKKILL